MDWPLRCGIFLAPFHPTGMAGSAPCCSRPHEWANPAATNRSYELFAQEVLPRFNGALVGPEMSMAHVREHRDEFIGAAGTAVMAAFQERNDATS